MKRILLITSHGKIPSRIKKFATLTASLGEMQGLGESGEALLPHQRGFI